MIRGNSRQFCTTRPLGHRHRPDLDGEAVESLHEALVDALAVGDVGQARLQPREGGPQREERQAAGDGDGGQPEGGGQAGAREIAVALGRGAVHGARGNSGVILSQILRALADVTTAAGELQPLDMGRLQTIITEACEGLAEVDGALIERETLKNLYDGVAEKDVNTALVMTARTLVEREPNYSFVTARLLMDTLRAEALGFLGVAESAMTCPAPKSRSLALSAAPKRCSTSRAITR